ncbi:hypothetical protein MD484_g8797, partial [Candolleomyces efflorescens]
MQSEAALQGQRFGSYTPQTAVTPIPPRPLERLGWHRAPTAVDTHSGPSTSSVPHGFQNSFVPNHAFSPSSSMDQLAEDLYRRVANGQEFPPDNEEERFPSEEEAITPYQHEILQEILSHIPADRTGLVSSWLSRIIIRALRTVAHPQPYPSSVFPPPPTSGAHDQGPTTDPRPIMTPCINPIRREICICRCICGRGPPCRCPCTCGRIFDNVDQPWIQEPHRDGDHALFNFDLYTVCDVPSHRDYPCHRVSRVALPQHNMRPIVERTLQILNDEEE